MPIKIFFMCLAASLALAVAGREARAVSALAFEQVSVLDGSGQPITGSEPSAAIMIRASGTFDRFGMVILFGTVTGTNWSQKLTPRFRVGFSGTYSAQWSDSVPFNATGTARIDITGYSPLLAELTLRTAFLDITPFTASYVGSGACSQCHKKTYAAWQDSLHYPYTGCESCHGPGGKHVTSPPSYIIVDQTASVCMPCHSRNNGKVIEAQNGFIKPQQQYNEWVSTPHGKILQCAGCHDPHYSMSAPQAIKMACTNCHPGKTVYLGMQHLKCESCHMAPAVNTGGATGFGPYRSGDAPSHIWRIKPQSPAGSMYAGNIVVKDFFGPFLTLDIACMSCHNGTSARLYDFESVQQTATLVH